ncbi:MAG: DUF262 domain-containing protein [Pseudobacter sp.]|uniref:DUF262 domain-containing protein n=1 Tax=Pseudobacter sp. TaxID=2045420 RepID=UPI003F7ECB50
MPKPKAIYSLQGTFTNLLSDTDKSCFLIPTYQRGYKWIANEGKGQVDILMKDLLRAFKSNINRYYLQFLTLKERNDELEVIDGQQRLTTLTILNCVIQYLLKAEISANYTFEKLRYQTRQNFVEQYIYKNIETLLNAGSWEQFKGQAPDHDNQDVFYIYHATNAIRKFLDDNIASEIAIFSSYISNSVCLIINLLDKDLNSEKIFINVNKGIKLSDEDLVKGMLITRSPLEQKKNNCRYSEIEINEWRTNLGRQWDELAAWANQTKIRAFFKPDKNDTRLTWLIKLAYPEIPRQEGHPIFDYLDEKFGQKQLTASGIFNNIRDTKMLLNDWYSEPEIANLLGFVIHAWKSSFNGTIWQELRSIGTRTGIVKSLKFHAKQLLPLDQHGNLSKELNYEDHFKEIFNIFLLLDVSKFFPLNGRQAAVYDFSKIADDSWSLEHIFPQNAKELSGLDNLSEEDLNIIREIIDIDPRKLNDDPSLSREGLSDLYNKIMTATSECSINKQEKELLSTLLGSNAAPDLHRIGNLSLLEKNMNSGLSNKYFNEKRKKLVDKVSKGKFVPFHTYDVFSKLLLSGDTGLHTWSKKDILDHEKYIIRQIKTITEYLNIP